MKREFSVSISQEGRWFVAQCLEVDVASQGTSEEEALAYLQEALDLHFTPPVATIVGTHASLECEQDRLRMERGNGTACD